MKSLIYLNLSLFLWVLSTDFCFCQATDFPVNWFNLSVQKDKVNGIGTNETYENYLKNRPSTPVVVAVIDSGVDIEHEDLKSSIWTNENEIPDNGKDDDHNGYIDDIHGWNFIGNSKGENVLEDSYEITRDYARDRDYFLGKEISKLNTKDKEKYDLMIANKKVIDGHRLAAQQNIDEANEKIESILSIIEMVNGELDGKDMNKENIKGIKSEDPMVMAGRELLLQINEFRPAVVTLEEYNKVIMDEFNPILQKYLNELEFGYNPDGNPRTLVGDDYNDLYQKGYGNNNVKGPDASHGTHVAGIIAAKRNNEVGIDGIADNVKIMALRAVPDGDERDKDIANAIRYAVDNGAKVINMSFGKGSSPNKDVIDEAVKYAEKKDVVIVHAAGNSNADNDSGPNFPNKKFKKSGLFSPKYSKIWLEIGASTPFLDENLVAPFSNYGKKTVDVFAPGYQINSTIPDNKYAVYDGTSMASPMTTGMVGLLRSYFPRLSAKQIVEIVRTSSSPYVGKVNLPGTQDKKVTLLDLSNTGGIINIESAVKLALKTKGKLKSPVTNSPAIRP